MNTRCVRETILTNNTHQPGRVAPLARQTYTLQPRHVTTLKLLAGTRLEVKRGVCWLTAHRNSGDIILQPGQSWEVRKATEFLASALGRDSCLIEIVQPVN